MSRCFATESGADVAISAAGVANLRRSCLEFRGHRLLGRLDPTTSRSVVSKMPRGVSNFEYLVSNLRSAVSKLRENVSNLQGIVSKLSRDVSNLRLFVPKCW
jgi:hypothetical protein